MYRRCPPEECIVGARPRCVWEVLLGGGIRADPPLWISPKYLIHCAISPKNVPKKPPKKAPKKPPRTALRDPLVLSHAEIPSAGSGSADIVYILYIQTLRAFYRSHLGGPPSRAAIVGGIAEDLAPAHGNSACKNRSPGSPRPRPLIINAHICLTLLTGPGFGRKSETCLEGLLNRHITLLTGPGFGSKNETCLEGLFYCHTRHPNLW